MAVLYDVRFEKDPSVNCYGHWICLGGKVWVKEGDSITVYFDVRNYSSVKAYAVKIKLKDELGTCEEQSVLKDIDANSTASDNFVVYPKGNCRLKLTIELYDPDRKEYVEVDSKCCFEVATLTEFPSIWPTYMGSTELVEGVEHTLWVKVYKSTDGGSEALPGATVHHYIKRGGTYEWIECKISDEEGWVKFKWAPEKKAGETEWHKFEATTGGSSDHWYQSFKIIAKKNTHLTLTCPYSCEKGKTFTAKAELSYVTPEQKFEPLANKTIDFYINDVYQTSATTDSDGKASATLTCPSSSFTVKAKFAGDDEYEASEDTCSVSVTTPAPTPTPTPTPPPTTPTPTPPPTTPTPTPPPTTPPPGPPPPPKAKFEFVSAGFHYWETPEFKPEDFVSVSYDVENDEWKFEGETITEILIPDTASALFFSGTVRQTETGASAVCEVRVYDELNDEVLLTVNSEEEISGEFSFGNQTYFYDGKERRIRVQVGAYEAGTWFKQDETEPLTLKSGKIAVVVTLKGVPEGVKPFVRIRKGGFVGWFAGIFSWQSIKEGATRVFWTEEEGITSGEDYVIDIGEKTKLFGLIEGYSYKIFEAATFKYEGTKVDLEINWEEKFPSWFDDLCDFLGIDITLRTAIWELWDIFTGNWKIVLTGKDWYGNDVEPTAIDYVCCGLDVLFAPFSEFKAASAVAQRGLAVLRMGERVSTVADWLKTVKKSKLIRGIASMSGETFEKKFLDKLAAGDTKAAEDLLDSVLVAPEDSSVNIFKRVVNAIRELRKGMKDGGKTVDEIEDALSKGRWYAAHAEQTIEVAKDTLKGSWSDIRKLYDQFIAAWEKESPENIYRAVFEGRFASVEHPVTKEAVSAFMSDIQELAQAKKVKVLVEGVEKEVPVYFDDIFHAFFLKEKDCVKSLKDAGFLNDFLDELRGYIEARPATYRGLIKQLSDDEFATIVADLKAVGKDADAALFTGLKEAAAREGAEGATILSVRTGEATEANLDEIVKKLEDAWDSAKGATPETRKAADSLCNDMIDNLKLTKTEKEYLSGKGLDETIETLKKDSDPKVRDVGEKYDSWWKRFKERAEDWLKGKGKSWDAATDEEKARGILHGFFGRKTPEVFACVSLVMLPQITERALWGSFVVRDLLNYYNLKNLSEGEIELRIDFCKTLCAGVAAAFAIELIALAYVLRKCPYVFRIVATMELPAIIVGSGSYLGGCALRVWDVEQRGASLVKEGVTLRIKTNVDDAYVIIDGYEYATRTKSERYIPYSVRYVDNSIRTRDYADELVGELPSGQMDFWITIFKQGYFPREIPFTIFPSDKGKEIKIEVNLEPLPEEYKEAFSDIIQDIEDMYAEKEELGFENLPAPCGGYAHPRIFEYDVTDVATVRVDSSPAGAEIWIYDDDAGWLAAGITPSDGKAKIKLPPGTWKVKLVRREDDRIVEEVEKEVTVYHGGIATPSEIYVKFGAPTPTAVFGYSPSDIYVGTEVTFDASGSSGGDDEAIVSYKWHFGDGTTATGSVVKHTFAEAGKYKVTLVVENESGNTASTSTTITVKEISPTPTPTPTPAPECPEPSAQISYIETTNPYVEQGIELSASGSSGGDTHTIISYEWDFGDGTTATGVSVRHAWKKTGKYKVVLTVTNDCGATDTATKEVTVKAINDVCDLIKARGGVSEITSVDIQQMILAFNGIIDYYFTVNRDAIYGMAAYKRGDIDTGDDLTGCKFAGFLRLWRLFEKMRR